MEVTRRIRSALRPYRLRWEPSFFKQKRTDKEYASGQWDHCEETSGAWVYGFVERYSRGGRILDLGCGSGNTANEINSRSYTHYTGVELSGVAIEKARQRSERSGRGVKNIYVHSDILTYTPQQMFDLILLRESIYHIPQAKLKMTLDRYARHLAPNGVFLAYLSRDGTSDVKKIVAWIEINYHVVEKQRREAPAVDAARFFGDAFVLVFRVA